MKKQFVKPEIQKISLNFHENIVASQERYSTINGYRTYYEDPFNCYVHKTTYVYYDLRDYNIYNSAEVHGCLSLWFPPEQAARLLGHAI